MEIHKHFDMLLHKYNLAPFYRKFIISSLANVFVRDGFFWSLLYLCDAVKVNKELMKPITIVLLSLIGLNIPVERFYANSRAELIKQVSIANNKFFTDKIINIDKTKVLDVDLIKYLNHLTHLNENFIEYIDNIKIKNDIPFRIMTLIIIAVRKDMSILIGLFSLFFMLITILNEIKMTKEIGLTDKYFKYEDMIVKYLTNSKSLIINNEFNKDYLYSKFDEYSGTTKKIMELNNNLESTVNVTLFGYIITVIMSKLDTIDPLDFFSYFLIIYDIEFIADKINQFYKNKVNYNKMKERLNYLYGFEQNNNNSKSSDFDGIEISYIFNKLPKIEIKKPISIENNDHILVSGESGSGKTTLLYILKGIVKAEKIAIEPNINDITSKAFLTLPNHKNLFDGYSWDIITNFEKEPDTNLINQAIEKSKTSVKKENYWIDIEKLSNGERIRLLLARIIYIAKKKDYKILLFDEIDESLNEKLAVEVCKNLLEIFNDKIILYITHHEKVKSLFNKRLSFKKGQLTEQF